MFWNHPERGKAILLAGDLAIVSLAAILAALLHPGHSVSLAQRIAALAIFLALYPVNFYVFDLYDVGHLNGAKTLTYLLAGVASGTLLSGFCFYLFPWLSPSRVAITLFAPAILFTCFVWRRFYARHQKWILARQPVLLIGTADDAARVSSILQEKDSHYELLGLLRVGEASESYDPALRAPVHAAAYSKAGPLHVVSGAGGLATAVRMAPVVESPAGVAVFQLPAGVADLGVATADLLENLVLGLRVHTVVVHPEATARGLTSALTRLRFQGVRIATFLDFHTQLSGDLPLDALDDTWLSFATGFQLLQARLFHKFKRLADLLIAGAGLLLSLPISLLAVAAIWLDSPGPALYRQWRVGRLERPFLLLKFRSMRHDAEGDGSPQWARPDDPRVTRIGKILRKLRVDEIPQMINVLRGEMSFVGPRPERPAFVAQLKSAIPFYDLRHFALPGITGWAQVNYPYGASIEDARRKLQYDLYYIRNASPAMDLKILLRTIRVVLFRRGSR